MSYFVDPKRMVQLTDFLQAGMVSFEVDCDRCPLRKSFDVRRELARRGDMTMGAFLTKLRAPCPKGQEPGAYGVCGARCRALIGMYAPAPAYEPRPDRGPR